jgi:hypothetical protein
LKKLAIAVYDLANADSAGDQEEYKKGVNNVKTLANSVRNNKTDKLGCG